MAFDTSEMLRRLHELQRQTARARRQDEILQAAQYGATEAAALSAALDAACHARAMLITTQHIRAQVAPFDGLGNTVESLSELVLRAVRMVLIAELVSLHAIIATPPEEARSRALYWGRFLGVDDLTVSMHASLEQITAEWLSYRGMAVTERDAYRCAHRRAHIAIRELGTGSEFAGFVDRGLIRTDWPQLQATCARIQVALAVSIDVESHDPGDALAVVFDEHSAATPSTDGVLPKVSLTMFEAAIADLVRLTQALTSANAALAFADGMRRRDELEAALRQVQALAYRVAGGSQRAEALRRLSEMQCAATRALLIAPAPNPVAVKAAAAGNMCALQQEEQVWITVRLARSNPHAGLRRRRTTQPDLPRARHHAAATPHEVNEALADPPVAQPPPDEAD